MDLVVMALCRAQPGPGPVFGPHVRSILVLSDAGRVLDVGALADALCARVARKNDEEDPTLERRQVALDFATLAVAAGGNDYLPPLSVASHALWDAYKAQDRALYDEASGRVDLEVLGSLLEDRHVPASRYLGTAALVSAQTWTRSPSDPRDRIERETPHSDHDTPKIEGRSNVDFHTGTMLLRSTRNGDASRRTLGVILARKTGGRRRLGRWSWLCCGKQIGSACGSWRRAILGPSRVEPPLYCTEWSGGPCPSSRAIPMIPSRDDGRRRPSARLLGAWPSGLMVRG